MRVAGAAVLLMVLHAQARADFLDWKDGCPAYFPPEHAPSYISDLRTHGGSSSFGALPELDSPIGQSRLGFEDWVSELTPHTGTNQIPTEYAWRTFAQFDLDSGPMLGGWLSRYHLTDFDSNLDVSDHLGDLTIFGGYRHTGYLFGPMFRTGLALRFAGAIPITARTHATLTDQREQLAINSPFRGASFGVEQPLTATIEYRIELVGCRAPYVSLRVDFARWLVSEQMDNGLPDDPIYDVPIELAIGAYPWGPVAFYTAIGEEFRSSGLRYSRLTRVAFGVDVELITHDLRVGIRGSGISGNSVGGWELGGTLSWILPRWGSLE